MTKAEEAVEKTISHIIHSDEYVSLIDKIIDTHRYYSDDLGLKNNMIDINEAMMILSTYLMRNFNDSTWDAFSDEINKD